MNQRFILGVATLVWGFQAELLWFALPMALILEGRFLVGIRWALEKTDFYQVSDLTAVALILVMGFLFMNAREYHFIKTLILWLPIVFYGLVIVHSYSTSERMTLDVLFRSLRRQKEPVTQSWDMHFFYLGLCLLSTSIETDGDVFYFPYVVGMIAWALLPLRKTRYPLRVWMLVIAVVFLTGSLTHYGLRSTHLAIKQATERWIASWVRQRTDPLHAYTAIGHVGRFKLSDSIAFRIDTDGRRDFPRLLVEARYDRPDGDRDWGLMQAGFEALPHADDFTWRLHPTADDEKAATFYLEFDRKRALVPVPDELTELDQLPALEIKKNHYGTLQATELIPSPLFHIKYSNQTSLAGEMTEGIDTYLPEELRPLLESTIPHRDLTPSQAVDLVERFFDDFSYSLYQTSSGTEENPLATFLNVTRAGHCEYFASATALLLRHLGVPARYVVGYNVQEFNEMVGMYIVRQRHAHAWAEAYVDGAWRPVDTTPGVWLETESAQSSFIRPVADLLDNVTFLFQNWWNDQKIEDYQIELTLIVLMLAGFLGWRLYTSEQVNLNESRGGDGTPIQFPGMESPFFRVEQFLAQQGLMREPGELLSAYLKRLDYPELMKLVSLHQRWRFDPQGLSDVDKQRLARGVEDWLRIQNDVVEPA